MVTTVATPSVARRVEGHTSRTLAVAARNGVAARHVAYWWVLFSGFFEPLLYLLSIGIGVGALIGDLRLDNGTVVSYAAFVAPGMLAASAMQGAFAETTFNFYGKLKYRFIYDAMIATPVRPMEIAVGELLWAMLRGAAYSAAFLTIMVWMGLAAPLWALAAFPASMLVGFAFGAVGMTLATFVRGWQDFEYVIAPQFALFLFSGTFTPIEQYPVAMQWVVQATPLYHAVELVRSLTTGVVGTSVVVHVAYLAALTVLGLSLAARRMNAVLRK